MATLIPPENLLDCYRHGIFPMDDPRGGRLRFFCPDPRGVIFPRDFRIPHGSRRTVADPAWECRVDTGFREVVAGCAARRETWISPRIIQMYCALHEAGHAHSVEIYRGGRLAGGLYGVRAGSVFFGESMFHTVPGASKAALARLFDILRAGGFGLLEIQWTTPHLRMFGATEIPLRKYLGLLDELWERPAKWPAPGCWPLREEEKPR